MRTDSVLIKHPETEATSWVRPEAVAGWERAGWERVVEPPEPQERVPHVRRAAAPTTSASTYVAAEPEPAPAPRQPAGKTARGASTTTEHQE